MLEPLEARVPDRAIRLEPMAAEPQRVRTESRFAPVAAFFASPTFSRLGDIMAANMGAMLDRAEDPARMIRMIILEMEETLVEVRASAARAIADAKEIKATVRRLETIQSDWAGKAELALEKGREDLAKAALGERHKAANLACSLERELEVVATTCRAYDADITKLQGKLREARGRQHAIATRMDGAMNRARAAELLNGSRTAEAFAQFERLERRADVAEGRADALALGNHEDELAALKTDQAIEAELAAMKTALGRRLN
ncbi:PspA/IM30 family protein [Sphingomonas arenae]|uniref:PspA/IM30 family protein n=1 Tax=Sphingomonas arenae TaxID=2812555 RepID=UPI002350B501|nr:PspA/IM30 family protein [Sphingomonas arenae]